MGSGGEIAEETDAGEATVSPARKAGAGQYTGDARGIRRRTSVVSGPGTRFDARSAVDAAKNHGELSGLARGFHYRSFVTDTEYMTRVLGEGRVMFRLFLPDAKCVRLAGDFSGWEPSLDMDPGPDGWWQLCVAMSPGEHRFRYEVDGRWFVDFNADFDTKRVSRGSEPDAPETLPESQMPEGVPFLHGVFNGLSGVLLSGVVFVV